MQEDRLREIWDNILKATYSEIEWRDCPVKDHVQQLWGRRRDSGEWVKTAYERNIHG